MACAQAAMIETDPAVVASGSSRDATEARPSTHEGRRTGKDPERRYGIVAQPAPGTQDDKHFALLDEAVSSYPEVMECSLTAGDGDYQPRHHRLTGRVRRLSPSTIEPHPRDPAAGLDSSRRWWLGPSPSPSSGPINRHPWRPLLIGSGAAEKTRTSTSFRTQRPQRCASTSSATTARETPPDGRRRLVRRRH